MTNSESKNLAKGLAFLSPWLIGLVVFTLLPIGLSAYYSLCDYTLLQKPTYIGAQNYKDLAADPVFWKSLGVTAYYAPTSRASRTFPRNFTKPPSSTAQALGVASGTSLSPCSPTSSSST